MCCEVLHCFHFRVNNSKQLETTAAIHNYILCFRCQKAMKEFKCDSELNNSFPLCITAKSVIFAVALALLISMCWCPLSPLWEWRPADTHALIASQQNSSLQQREMCQCWHKSVTSLYFRFVMLWLVGIRPSVNDKLTSAVVWQHVVLLYYLYLPLSLLLRSARDQWISPFTGSWETRWRVIDEAPYSCC